MDTAESHEVQDDVHSHQGQGSSHYAKWEVSMLFEPIGKPTEYGNLNLQKPEERKISNFSWQ